MNSEAQWILTQCSRLKVDQGLTFDRRLFDDAFPGNPFTGEPGMSRFMGNLAGSAWGEWEVYRKTMSGHVVVWRRRGGNRRVSVDWDRRHLFEKLPDGSYERRDFNER